MRLLTCKSSIVTVQEVHFALNTRLSFQKGEQLSTLCRTPGAVISRLRGCLVGFARWGLCSNAQGME